MTRPRRPTGPGPGRRRGCGRPPPRHSRWGSPQQPWTVCDIRASTGGLSPQVRPAANLSRTLGARVIRPPHPIWGSGRPPRSRHAGREAGGGWGPWSVPEMVRRRPAATDQAAAEACPYGRRPSSVSGPWSAPGSSRSSAPRARWPAQQSGSRSSWRAGSPCSRATPSPSSARAIRRRVDSSSTSSVAGGTATSRACSRGCCSRSTRSSPRWSPFRSAATPVMLSPTTPTG